MKKLTLALVTIFLISTLSTQTTDGIPDHPSILYFSQYDELNGTWTNITITENQYSVLSDDLFVTGLSGSFFFDWYSFQTSIEIADFYNLQIDDKNATIVLEVLKDGLSNKVALLQIPQTLVVDLGLGKMLGMAIDAKNRVAGRNFIDRIWPVELQTMIMESYPEQYAVSATFQRGNDMLADVISQNVTLFAGADLNINQINTTWLKSARIAESVIMEIASPGSSVDVSFPSFSIITLDGADNDVGMSDLGIVILMESGDYIAHSFESGMKIVGSSNIAQASQYVGEVTDNNLPSSSDDTTDDDGVVESDNLELPISYLSLLSLLAVPILRKKLYSKYN